MPIDGSMDKEDVGSICNGILLDHKKYYVWNNAICSKVDEPDIFILSEVSQTKTNTVWYHLHVESKKKWQKKTYLQSRNRLTDIESKLTVTKVEMGGGGIN